MVERPTLHAVLKLFEDEVSDDKAEIEGVLTSKELTRDSFFDVVYWAILVANMKFDTARSWEDKARACGFPFDWRELADWDDRKFNRWCRKMARELADPKEDLVGVFRHRWWAIWDIGWRLAQFESEAAFSSHYFDGKKHGRDLTDEDFHRLARIKRTEGALFRVGDVSIYFILRNLGGDFLKPDTWIKAFADWYGCDSVSQLASMLRSAGIHCGRFDAYCWDYCASNLNGASDAAGHFDGLF